ncbi:hypothetical protein M231_03517 [Tremella mesenterica]|uniref:RanBD1 domain-containing protein n=1 Tax=Tremella mesenterica TaxID=5217 RepID=A0A4Q1BN36_TREME|nr:hypothetical protein M231_03517 [Tremella mesenterica]
MATSPPGDPGSPDKGKNATSLKRMREGSIEPTQADVAAFTPIQTKKNRLDSRKPLTPDHPSPTSSDEQDEVEEMDGVDNVSDGPTQAPTPAPAPLNSPPSSDEEIEKPPVKEPGGVGEVRRKVEEMVTNDPTKDITDLSVEPIVEDSVEVVAGDESMGEWETIKDNEVKDAREHVETVPDESREREDVELDSGDDADPVVKGKRKSIVAEEEELEVEKKVMKSESEEAVGDEGRVSPKLVEEKEKVSVPQKPQSAFGAFASISSPFAALKPAGDIPTKVSSTPESSLLPPAPSVMVEPKSKDTDSGSDAASQPKKPQATFASFSSASPFATLRSASPLASSSALPLSTATKPSLPSVLGGGAFGSYSNTSSPFAVNSKKESQEPSTFDDKLKETTVGDEDEGGKVHLAEQYVSTGEEDEENRYQTRAKLFIMQADGGWKERGVGMLKLLVRRSDGKGARLVMRADGVLRLILNCALYTGMSCLEDGKHVRMTVFDEGQRQFVTLRLGTAKAALELSEVIHDYIPLTSASASKSPESVPEAV